MTTGNTSAARQVRDVAVDSAIFVACIVPLLLIAHVPLIDLPNHLARQFIIRDWTASADLHRFYFVRWVLTPNLGLEIFVAIVRQITSIDMAVRLFCIATLALIFVGTRLINTWIGGPFSRAYRIAPLLFYNGPFLSGLLSYCFGVGLALVAFGLYLPLRRARMLFSVPIFAAIGILILLCHLAAFGLFAIAVGSFELAEAVSASRGGTAVALIRDVLLAQIRPALLLLPPLMLFMTFAAPSGTYLPARWGGWHDKLEGVAALTLFSNPALELTLLGLAVLGGAVALALRILRLDSRAVPMLVVFALVYAALPRVALGGGYVDYRIPSAVAFFALGFVVPGPAFFPWRATLGGWFALLTAGRVALVAVLWLSWEPIFTQFEAAFAKLPVGARLMVVEGQLQSTSETRSPPLSHIAALAVARRQAFMPQMFANLSGQILHFQPGYERLWQLQAPASLDRIDPAYNFLLVLYPEHASVSPQLHLSLVAEGALFKLYRVADAS